MTLFLNRPAWAATLTFPALIVLWEGVVRLGGWDAHALPGPAAVFSGLWELTANGALLRHSVASLFRVTAGFYLAVGLGIPLGICLGRCRVVDAFLNPLIQFLRPISPLAWIPLAMVWFGIGDKPAVFLIFLSSFFPLVTTTAAAVHEIKPMYFHVAANFDFTRRETISRLIVPAIIPSVVTALRIALGIAWVVVVAAEMIAVKSGLGYLILDARNALRTDYVIVGMATIGLIGLLLDRTVKRLGQFKCLAWKAVE